MIEDQPSRTAERVARGRAAHQILDQPRVFDDPVALKIIDPAEAENLRSSGLAEADSERYLRAFLVARSRYAEDQLAQAVQRGVKQYVVLGAGLDTFAYRNPFEGVRVFEVDHPATQVWKRSRLEASRVPLPASLAFVPIDFEQQTLGEGLERAGFRAQEPAFFCWLGVTVYLARETVMETFRWIISSCGQNGVVFDYAVPRSLLTPAGQRAFDALSNRVAASGEPFVTLFDPRELELEMRQLGYRHVENLGREEINTRYFSNRGDDLRVRGGGRLMSARGD